TMSATSVSKRVNPRSEADLLDGNIADSCHANGLRQNAVADRKTHSACSSRNSAVGVELKRGGLADRDVADPGKGVRAAWEVSKARRRGLLTCHLIGCVSGIEGYVVRVGVHNGLVASGGNCSGGGGHSRAQPIIAQGTHGCRERHGYHGAHHCKSDEDLDQIVAVAPLGCPWSGTACRRLIDVFHHPGSPSALRITALIIALFANHSPASRLSGDDTASETLLPLQWVLASMPGEQPSVVVDSSPNALSHNATCLLTCHQAVRTWCHLPASLHPVLPVANSTSVLGTSEWTFSGLSPMGPENPGHRPGEATLGPRCTGSEGCGSRGGSRTAPTERCGIVGQGSSRTAPTDCPGRTPSATG